jgi:hypothetical protein
MSIPQRLPRNVLANTVQLIAAGLIFGYLPRSGHEFRCRAGNLLESCGLGIVSISSGALGSSASIHSHEILTEDDYR